MGPRRRSGALPRAADQVLTAACGFAAGGCGCPVLLLVMGGAIVALGGTFMPHLPGLVLAVTFGGILGSSIFLERESRRSRLEGEEPTTGPIADLVRDAARRRWSHHAPGIVEGQLGIRVVIRAPAPARSSSVSMIASNALDSLAVLIEDDTGQLLVPAEGWRGPRGDGEGLLRMIELVEGYLAESWAHVVSGAGVHRLVRPEELSARVDGDPLARVRSWLGTLNRPPGGGPPGASEAGDRLA